MPQPIDDNERIVYHYCDSAALISILENNKLWYTHAAYLNDEVEITRGIELLRSLVRVKLEHLPGDPVLSKLQSYLEEPSVWQFYVCCFCEKKDKLSQWRTYANDGQGFAIGFRVRDINLSTDGPFEGSFRPLSYDCSNIKNRFESLTNKFATASHVFKEDTTNECKAFCFDQAGAHIYIIRS